MPIVVGSGTGANYPIVAGALCRLEEIENFHIKGFISTSGSGVPFAFRARGPEQNMHKFLELAQKHPPMSMFRPCWNWPLVPGLFHLDNMAKDMEQYFSNRLGDNVIPHTLVTFNSDTKKPVLFSTITTPAVDTIKAMQASMAIPWLIRHVTIDEQRLTDGGVVNNFAINIPDSPAVGIRVLGAASEGRPWRWWGSYSWNHVDGMLMAQERAHIASGIWQKHKFITINSPISGMDFHLVDSDMIKKLFDIGYRVVDEKIKNGWKP